MNNKKIFNKFEKILIEKELIQKEFDGKITYDASLRQDLGADSLDTYELVYEIEEKFGISIPDEQAYELETVGDYVNYIQGALENKD